MALFSHLADPSQQVYFCTCILQILFPFLPKRTKQTKYETRHAAHRAGPLPALRANRHAIRPGVPLPALHGKAERPEPITGGGTPCHGGPRCPPGRTRLRLCHDSRPFAQRGARPLLLFARGYLARLPRRGGAPNRTPKLRRYRAGPPRRSGRRDPPGGASRPFGTNRERYRHRKRHHPARGR